MELNDTQYKVGDVVNGHRLTEQNGELAWLPVASDEAQPKPKKSRRALWITLGAIGAVLLLIIIIGSLNRPTDTEDTAADDGLTPGQIAEREAAEEEPEPEPEPAAPAPELGTLQNPAPAGTPISSKSWDGTTYDTVVVGKVDPANDLIAQTNQFNEAAAPDHRYVVLTYTVTNTTADASKAVMPGSAVYDISIVDAATGQSYPQAFVVLPNDMSNQNDIYQGQAATGEVAYMVPNSVTQLLVGSGGVFVQL